MKKSISKKARRIASNRRHAARKRGNQARGLLFGISLDPCALAMFDYRTAPHKPKCLCVINKMAMRLMEAMWWTGPSASNKETFEKLKALVRAR